jgi:hypothetical protein
MGIHRLRHQTFPIDPRTPTLFPWCWHAKMLFAETPFRDLFALFGWLGVRLESIPLVGQLDTPLHVKRKNFVVGGMFWFR